MKFIIGGPYYRSQIDARLGMTWVQLGMTGAGMGHQLRFIMFEDGLLDMSRNKLMARALATDADWFISMDADTSLDGTNAVPVFTSLEETRDTSVAIIGWPMPKGHGGWNLIPLDGKPPGVERPSRRREVGAIGTGALAFRLDWYREHWGAADELPWFQTVVIKEPNGRFSAIGEDYGHCGQVGRRGGKVIMDPRPQWRHHTSRAGSAAAREAGE